jgi:hypothetical protein
MIFDIASGIAYGIKLRKRVACLASLINKSATRLGHSAL